MRSGSIYSYMVAVVLRGIPALSAALLVVHAHARADQPEGSVGAERPPWALVTIARDGRDPAPIAAALRTRLEAAGVPLAPAAEVAARLEERDSSDATPIAASDIARWASRSREALRYLSRGDYAEARRALLEAQAISERAAEALNRETLRARQVLDTCLFVVRASLETNDVQGAEEQARRCRRLVPRMHASAYTHTPEVRELVARIDAQLGAERAGTLTVSSDASGCDVRINGVYFGETPLSTSELPRGEYGVQVECDEAFRGRVHRVRIADQDVRLDVRIAFDRALRSRPELSLVYAEATFAAASSDAAAVARILQRPVLLVDPSGDEITVVAIDANGRRSSPSMLSPVADAGHDIPTLARYARPESSTPVVLDDEQDYDDAAPLEPGMRLRRRVGLTLAGTGIGLVALGASLNGVRVHRGERLDEATSSTPGFLELQHDYLALRPYVLGSALGGGLVSAAGSSIAVRTWTHRRMAGWIGGAVGVVLASVATIEVTRAPLCYGDAICTQRDIHIDRAVLLGAAAGPALALPIAASSGATEHGVRASVHVGADVASLQLRGSLR